MIQRAIDEKMSQWDREALINAKLAKAMGKSAVLVTYPTGLQKMRFGEPFQQFGMHYEVSLEIWNSI
jgi:transposase